VLLEIALVRIATLEDLDELAQLVAGLQSGTAASPAPRTGPASTAPSAAARGSATAQKKTAVTPPGVAAAPKRPASSAPAAAEPAAGESTAAATPSRDAVGEITPESAESIWRRALAEIEDVSSDYGSYYDGVAISAPNRLVVSFPARYNLQKERCERPQQKARFEAALARVAGRTIRVDFQLSGDAAPSVKPPKRMASARQQQRETEMHPMVQAAIELFGGEVIRVEQPRPSPDSEKE
jgi:hypothetical protein